MITEALHTASFVSHYNAYEVNNKLELMIVKLHQLPYPFPLHLITITIQEQVKTVVCPKHEIPVV